MLRQQPLVCPSEGSAKWKDEGSHLEKQLSLPLSPFCLQDCCLAQ